MSDTMTGLRQQIDGARDLQAVVRTMKALAASSVGEYEEAVRALVSYYRAVELGLCACLREGEPASLTAGSNAPARAMLTGAIVFGSDQGLVGQFNDVISDSALQTLSALPGQAQVWAVGERVYARLEDAGQVPRKLFRAPNSVKAIAALVEQLQIEGEGLQAQREEVALYVFHNRVQLPSGYQPVCQRLLPLDAQWQRDLAKLRWPGGSWPEVLDTGVTLRALIREYLFISIFRACAESLASESAARLASMARADRNIDELLETLQSTFHRLRQNSIDEELFDVFSGYEAMSKSARGATSRVQPHGGKGDPGS